MGASPGPAPGPDPNVETFGRLVVQLARAVTREVDRRMSDHGLTDAQWKPLWHLRAGRTATAGELALEADVDAGAMTRLLDRLAAKGHVERFRNKADRRIVWVRLTPSGELASKVVPEVLATVNQALLAGLSDAERRNALVLLDRLRGNALALSAAQASSA